MSIKIIITFFSIALSSYAQKADSLIQIYPAVGDTLSLFERNYFGLYTEIEDFHYAVFYLSEKDSFISKLYSSNNDTVDQQIRIQNQSSLDSLKKIIQLIDTMNSELFKYQPDILLSTKDGNVIEAQLEMFDENYLYIIASDITAEHTGMNRYRIPAAQVTELTLEGSSNVLAGMCIGGTIGLVIGALVSSSIKSNSHKGPDSFDNCAADMDESFNAAAAFVAIALGAFLVGTFIGAGTSSDDQVIYFDSNMDVLKLRGHCAYILNKEILKDRKYHDIY